MLLLALDTASPVCAVAITDGRRILAQRSEVIGTGHAERLMPMVAEVLDAAGMAMAGLTAVAATVGPGSFTGLRVGLSAARGFAQALSVPAVGVTTLEAIAADAFADGAPAPLLVAIDARRGEVHAQMFAAGAEPLDAPRLIAVADASALAAGAVAGTGAVLPGFSAPAFRTAAATGSIGGIAALAADRLAGRRAMLAAVPLYLRGADARPQDGFALERAAS